MGATHFLMKRLAEGRNRDGVARAAAGRPPAIQCDGAKLIREDSAGLVK